MKKNARHGVWRDVRLSSHAASGKMELEEEEESGPVLCASRCVEVSREKKQFTANAFILWSNDRYVQLSIDKKREKKNEAII